MSSRREAADDRDYKPTMALRSIFDLSFSMIRSFLLIVACAAAFFTSGCANDLSPEVTDRGPAPYSPDPAQFAPTSQQMDPLGQRGGGGGY
jgi:hypothetical protein